MGIDSNKYIKCFLTAILFVAILVQGVTNNMQFNQYIRMTKEKLEIYKETITFCPHH